MNCPSCGTDNPDDAHTCHSCDKLLAVPPCTEQSLPVDTSSPTGQAKIYSMSVASFIMSIIFIPSTFFALQRNGLSCFIVLFGLLIIPIWSIASLIIIIRSKGLLRGKAWSITSLILWSIIAFLFIFPLIEEMAIAVHCGHQLKGLGAAIKMYHNDFDGQYPPNLKILIETEDVSLKSLSCFNSDELYTYRGVDLPTNAPREMIIVHDDIQNHPWKERNFLFANFNIKRIDEEDIQAVIDRDNELRRELGLSEKPLE